MSYQKLLTAAIAAVFSFLASAPASLRRAAFVALWFVVTDQLTGVLCARIGGQIASRAFREKLRSKLLCYAQILILAGGVGILADSWSWVNAAWWAICAAEGLSIAENLRGLLKSAGPQLAPIARLLDRLTGVLTTLDLGEDKESAS